jgi:hypothetical protein
MIMNTIGFYFDKHIKSTDIVCFINWFICFQRINVMTKYTPYVAYSYSLVFIVKNDTEAA